MAENDKAYIEEDSFSFQGTPEDIEVEVELTDTTNTMSVYDPYRLAEVLVEIGQRMTGIELYDYQKPMCFRIIYSILAKDGAEITGLFSRQSGKSEIVVFTSVTLAVLLPVLAKIFPKELGYFKNGIKMGLFAPQGEQVETVYRRCMTRLLSEPVRLFLDDPDILDGSVSQVHFKLKSGSTLTGQSAAKQAKVESKSYSLVYIDESQEVDSEKVRKSIIPMTAATFGTIVRTGTPARHKGDFYETIQNNKKHDKKLKSDKERLKKQLHFQYNYQDVIASKKRQYLKDKQEFHLLYEKAVNRDKKSQGENSDSFRMSYKIEWLLEIGMFITEDALEENCYAKRLGIPKLEENDFVVAGLDIASARNNTVLTTAILDAPADDFGERPKKTILDWLVVGNTNYEELFHIVAQELIDKRVRVLFADYTGVGRALTDVLMHHLGDYIDIVPYTFSPASKSDMWKALDEDIINRNIIIPAHKSVRERKEFKQFEDEMIHLTKRWKGSFMVCEKTAGWNDDMCDSLGLMNLAGNYLYVPQTEMEVTENTIINTKERYNLRNQSRW